MLYHLIRAYGNAINLDAASDSGFMNKHLDKAMLLCDQFCLGDQLSNPSAPSSAYRQYHLPKVIMMRLYHKLFFVR